MALLLAASAFGCRSLTREPWETAPLPPAGVEVTRLQSGPVLNIDRVRFWFAEMQEPRFFLALVPSGFSTVTRVLVLNHGWADRPEDLLRELRVAEVYTAMLSAGEVEPAIIVLPDIRFPDSYRRDADKYPFGQFLPLVAEDVAGHVAKTYGVPPDSARWGVAGFSFGGLVALDIVRRYSGRFGSASVVSTFFDEDWTFWPAAAPPPGRLDSRGRGKQTVVAPGPVPRLFLACGTEDRMYEAMVNLHERLTVERIAHDWQPAPGGHTWPYWSSVLKPIFAFHLGTGAGRPVRPGGAGPGAGGAG
jgi:enterochelin esterase-like enzyme